MNNPYQDGLNKGYLLGIVYALGSAPDTVAMLFEATVKELPEDERQYWRDRYAETVARKEESK